MKSSLIKTSTIFAILIAASLILRGGLSESDTALKPFAAGKFISPDVCGQCHDSIHGMWEHTMHSFAMDDPLFRAATKMFVKEASHAGQAGDAEHCVGCHNPIAFRSGQIKGSSDDYSKTDKVTARAISCDLCHSINEIVANMNAMFNTEPGNGEDSPGVKRGPRNDAEPMYHEAAFSEIHTKSEICGTCHNVTHTWYKTKLESTFDEWHDSPYNSSDPSKIVTCQDCHMRQSPGKPSTGMTERPDYPGVSAESGKERPNIYRHSVVGGNTFVTSLLGGKEAASMAEERLRNAATLEIIMPDKSQKKVDSFTVRVNNKGAGHYIPTGVTEFREVWLEISVFDNSGNRIEFIGGVKQDGELPSDALVFHTVFGDSLGKPTINVTKATKILSDNRIPPQKWADRPIKLAKPVKIPCRIVAELKYRSMSPALAGTLLGSKAEIPVITMAAAEKALP